ncbi:MAG: family 78 glycoside hydrolase catalytic domain [Verrucomicrobia bacterium]|jgi:acetyl esterase/lipase|nr:family 78 glycoside hydrolase catalytic domain [Verrucomicrobiota bacterium]
MYKRQGKPGGGSDTDRRRTHIKLLLLTITMMLNTNLHATDDGNHSPVYDVKYKQIAGDGPLLLDLYYPASVAPAAGYPLVVYTHGGGWAKGDRRIGDEGLKRMTLDALNEAGFCVASVDYRLCTRDGRVVMRDCVVDAKDAVRYLAKNATKLSLDPYNICTFGDSAGAHIAQMVLLSPAASFGGDSALADAEFRLVAGVSWYGPSDFEKTELFERPDGVGNPDRFGDRILKGDEDEDGKLAAYRQISPVNYLKADGPPLLMMQGELDPTMPVAHAEYMAERAAVAGAPVTVEIVKNRSHNWNPQQDTTIEPSLDEIVRTTVQFMKKHVDRAGASRVIWRDVPGYETVGFDKEFKHWQNDGFPLGNGRLGCMAFGMIQKERLQFNVDSLWTGDQNLEGEYKGATFGAYQNFGDLYIELEGGAGYGNYRRELDVEKALCSVSYVRDGVHFEREYFCSKPGDVIAARFTAGKKGQHSGRIRLVGAHDEVTRVDGNLMVFSGQLENGLDYEAQLVVIADGGQLTADGDVLEFSNCDGLTLYLAADTSYVSDYERKFMGDHPRGRLSRTVESAAASTYEDMKAEHQRDYSALYDRVHLDIGSTHPDQLALPMDQRLEKIRSQDVADPDLEELLFQYGRYLLIACSRPGALPANLQGLWNYSNNPRWLSDYHSNINLQMNYWGAEPANLAECHTPLLDMLNASLEPFRQGTRLEFGDDIRGFTIRTSHNPYGGMGWKWNIPASAWYARHFWEHYAYGGDKEFLEKVAYPYLKEVCHYWEDHLKELPDGKLVAPDGWSPEHGPREDGVAHDQQIIWDLFSNTIKASEALGVDEGYRQTLTSMRDRLVGPKIGSWGQLQEWMEDRDDPDCEHRHTSHLYAVYPGYQISRGQTPDFAEAAAVSLKARGESGDSRREWAWTWRTALWSRLGDAEMAHHMIRSFLKHNMLDNLIGVHPPLQIDGSLGITGSMCEMLMQSHLQEPGGRSQEAGGAGPVSNIQSSITQSSILHLLPALPKAWTTGHVKGLRARGGFTVDIKWTDGKLVSARVRADRKGSCTVRYAGQIKSKQLKADEVWEADLGGLIVSDLRCEDLVDPIGIDILKPRLSWRMLSGANGAAQSAYQVLVATSPDLLKEGSADLWDSGKVTTSQSQHIIYAGKGLSRGIPHYWTVRIWRARHSLAVPSEALSEGRGDGGPEKGAASPWGRPATWTYFDMAATKDWQAKWITEGSSSPWLRQSVELKDVPTRAYIYVNALGYFQLFINGKRVGADEFAPHVGQYNKRTFCITYDVTQYLKKGKNAIGFWLGSGWSQGGAGVKTAPCVRAQLEMTDARGEMTTVVTDASWRAKASSMAYQGQWKWNKFGGEVHTAAHDQPDWVDADFDDSAWPLAKLAKVADTIVSAEMLQRSRVIETMTPVKITNLGAATWLVDMGKAMTGTFEIIFPKAEKGRKVTMAFGDAYTPGPNGGVGRLNSFSQASEYICRGSGTETFKNRFNYASCRYILITNAPTGELTPGDIKGQFITTELPRASSFSCSDQTLNKIHEMMEHTLRCLMLGGYQVDCHSRERVGYGGDGQSSLDTTLSFFRSDALYRKWTRDWLDIQKRDGGFPYTAPGGGGGGGPFWSGFITAATLKHYQHYGDISLLRRNYPAIKKWFELAQSKTVNDLQEKFCGGWYLGDWASPKGIYDKGNAEVFIHPYMSYALEQAAQLADTLGESADAAMFRKWAAERNIATHKKFYDAQSGQYGSGDQVTYVLPLMSGVVPDKLHDKVFAGFEETLMVKDKGHLSTGLSGTYLMIQYLQSIGRDDLIYSFASKTTYPSWGYMLENGATATWEHWNGKASRIHNCYNNIGSWLIQGLAGIRPDPENPGFKNAIIKPAFLKEISYVNGSHESVYGTIESNWKRDPSTSLRAGGTLTLEVSIPANTTATVYVPAQKPDDVTVNGRKLNQADHVTFLRMENGRAVVNVDSGIYSITSTTE